MSLIPGLPQNWCCDWGFLLLKKKKKKTAFAELRWQLIDCQIAFTVCCGSIRLADTSGPECHRFAGQIRPDSVCVRGQRKPHDIWSFQNRPGPLRCIHLFHSQWAAAQNKSTVKEMKSNPARTLCGVHAAIKKNLYKNENPFKSTVSAIVPSRG